MRLKNITFNEYIELEDKSEYIFAMKYSDLFNTPLDYYKIGDFTELTFKEVKDLQYYVGEGLTIENIIEFLEGRNIRKDKIGKTPIVDFSKFQAYIIEEISRINEVESLSLAHSVSMEEESAGINEVSELGSYLQFRTLANEDITKIELIEKMPYSKCLLELVARKRIDDYQKQYVKNKSRR